MTEAPRQPASRMCRLDWRASEVKRKQLPAPEEIPDAEHELVIERVCAIDVAKAFGKVCVRTPRERRRVSRCGTSMPPPVR